VEELTFEEKEVYETTIVTLLLLAAVICVLVVHFFLHFPAMQYLPDCVASIFLGIGLGLSILAFYPSITFTEAAFFDPQAFFLLILPPIMFDAGYHSDKSNFLKNIGTIFAFAVFGTIIAAVVFAYAIYLAQSILPLPHLSLTETLMFGALISSVDPVATLAVFKAIKVDTVLHMIVFGESSLNDAVSISLFRTFSSFGKAGEEVTAWDCVVLFIYEFFGSIAIGIALGLLSALVFKHLNLREKPAFETALFILWSYIPFVLCEAVGLSGILGILFVGMMMVHYTHYSLSRVGQITTRQLYRSLGFLAETCCFVNLGLTLPFMQSSIRWGYVLIAIPALILSRTCSVFPTGYVCNLLRSKQISYSHMTVIWWSGIRGAVSFALALNFPTGHHDIVISTTMMIALFTVIVQGGGTRPMLGVLKLNATEVVMSKHGYLVDADYEEDEDLTPTGQRLLSWLTNLDKQHLQHWLRHTELLK
jgi:sodium/hydrogen exchanger 8